MNTIAIDCGASFIKAAYIIDGKITKKIEKNAPYKRENRDFLQVKWLSMLADMIKEIISELSEEGDEVVLCISNEMHGFTLAYENGQLFTDYISWQEDYGKNICGDENAIEILSKPNYHEDIIKSGMPVRASLPSSNLLYLYKSGVLQKAKDKLHFYTLGDYILYDLSGKKVGIHPTNAAATGLYNLETGQWNKKLIECCAGNYIIFPEIEEKVYTFDFRKRTIHAITAIGDQQAALLGAGLKTENQISYNLGTGAQVSRVSKKMVFSKRYQVRPYFGGMYLLTIPHIPSGRALNVYVRFVKDVLTQFQIERTDEEVWDILLQQAEKNTKELMNCDMSFFENAITDEETGRIGNIHEFGLTLGNLMDSVFTQLEHNLLEITDRLISDKKNIDSIVFSGGIARKVERVRKAILEQFGDGCCVNVASDETLSGLYYYGQMVTKDIIE